MARFMFLFSVFGCWLYAVETAPVPVVSIYDGDTLTVSADLGGLELPVRVRLLYLDTPELRGNRHGEAMPEGRKARDFVRELIGQQPVTLWFPGDQVADDRYGRLLAVVRLPDGSTIQEHVIRAGWSPVWEKYGLVDVRWRDDFYAAERAARTDSAGAWASAAVYMRNKANETMAPARD